MLFHDFNWDATQCGASTSRTAKQQKHLPLFDQAIEAMKDLPLRTSSENTASSSKHIRDNRRYVRLGRCCRAISTYLNIPPSDRSA
ncbi:hypothetical protein VTN02DRAFT_1719 [Thermoascus thermophilus]